MRFEWDAKKALANVVNHSVSFVEAAEVFADPTAVEGYDSWHSINETRFFIIGLSSRRLLYVVYTERSTDIVRIISARKANETERKIYEGRVIR